jgi:hydroxymethylbilane synthase
MTSPLRLGTRGSLLARSQSALIAARLKAAHADLEIETIIVKTTGDRISDRPLSESGGKGLFVKELEQALLDEQIDLAVHSCKDMPITMPLVDQKELTIAAIPIRGDPRDLLICRQAATIAALPVGATVGTGSLRRRCQILEHRPDLKIEPLRGNIDTRLNKLREGRFDAAILAAAGIERAGLMDPDWMHVIALDDLLPAAGQGALALQCRRSDHSTVELLRTVDDPATHACVLAERSIVAAVNGDCHSPIGAVAQIIGNEVWMRAVIGRRDGAPPTISAQARMPVIDLSRAVNAVIERLREQGVDKLLHGLADS